MSIDTPRTTAEEQHGDATHDAASTKAAQLQPTPSSNGEASLSIAIQGVEAGAKANKKRRK
jgi:hypothetical protein